jgi:hypothetical protein
MKRLSVQLYFIEIVNHNDQFHATAVLPGVESSCRESIAFYGLLLVLQILLEKKYW